MSILRDNPIFLREARWWLRGRWLRHNPSAAWTAGVIAVIFLWIYWRGLWAVAAGNQQELRPVWFWMVRLLLVLIVTLGPVLASTAIMKEREQRTWESLALTLLTARQIIFGKWLASLVPLCLLILAAMPLLLVICAILDTSFGGLLAVVAFFLLTAAAYTLLGVFCSFVARKSSTARMLSLGIAGFFAFGLFLVDWVLRTFLGLPNFKQYQPFLSYGYMNQLGQCDYGYYGAPAVTWFSPVYAIAVLSDWISQSSTDIERLYGVNQPSEDLADIWSAHPENVLIFYGLALVVAVAFCLYYILTRYRRDVRGGRPLGEPIT